jgi:hypothetical protein
MPIGKPIDSADDQMENLIWRDEVIWILADRYTCGLVNHSQWYYQMCSDSISCRISWHFHHNNIE